MSTSTYVYRTRHEQSLRCSFSCLAVDNMSYKTHEYISTCWLPISLLALSKQPPTGQLMLQNGQRSVRATCMLRDEYDFGVLDS